MHKFRLLGVRLLPHHVQMIESAFMLLAVVVMFSSQVGAVTRLSNRSLLVHDPNPGAITDYTFYFTYNTTAAPVGSVEFLFCYDPIPDDPCVAPVGLDASNATLSDQTGETGYAITTRTANRLVISRTATPITSAPSSYTFSGVKNPTLNKSFAARLSDYSSTDASGPLIDLGSVLSAVNEALTISAQVPPILYFCVAQQVSLDCTDLTGGNFTDLGTLSSSQTLIATSQMAAGTNASGGFAITANGPTMTAGTNIISQLTSPTPSAPGNNQFGLNLVANSSPNIGANADGSYVNAVAMPNYSTPNQFTYNDGDVIATAPNVSLERRFTVSYIVNTAPTLLPGVYTTTITYVCTGRF